MKAYTELLQGLFATGYMCEGRNGNTLKTHHVAMSFDLSKSFPLITHRKIPYKSAWGELAAFLRGAANIKDFKEQGCNYWDQWADENGELGPVYGAQWVNWNGINQLDWLIKEIKTNPSSRRLILSSWNVSELGSMALPPCYPLIQFSVTPANRLLMAVFQRSCDVLVGLPPDLVLYATLAELIAKETNLQATGLSVFIADAHIYQEHLEAAEEILLANLNPLVEELELVLNPKTSIKTFTANDARLLGEIKNPNASWNYPLKAVK